MIAYIIKGSTGFWDSYDWNVKIFGSKERAEEFMIKLNRIVDITKKQYENMKEENFNNHLEMAINNLDPKGFVADGVLIYSMEHVEVDDTAYDLVYKT